MIGIAGCGRMGGGMLAALLRAGFDVGGFDVRPPAEFGALASHITGNPDEFVGRLKTLITVVRDQAQTEDVLFGAQNFVDRAADLSTIVISSTLSPRYVTALRSRVPAHIALVDAPMSGAQIAATEGQLSFMLGGTTADLDRLQPFFAAMGQHFHRIGAFGAGMQAKVLNNLLAASHLAMTRLVLDWAETAGLDQSALLALIETSSGQNWLASGFERIEFACDGYTAENTLGILVKDVTAALDAAPEGADTILPRTVQATIRALRPIRTT